MMSKLVSHSFCNCKSVTGYAVN